MGLGTAKFALQSVQSAAWALLQSSQAANALTRAMKLEPSSLLGFWACQLPEPCRCLPALLRLVPYIEAPSAQTCICGQSCQGHL